MDAETLAHWRDADALFDHWLDLLEGERDAWLAAQAPAAPVRRRFDQLVSAHRNPRIAPIASGDTLAGTRLGQWQLESELGRGGMAVVYRGWREQGMARQQAAIKILTLGALSSSGRERFQREAAILARLNHPNITALVDSGVADDGTCWLAMPLVEGERIDHWCEANAPDARAIVRLYLQVCDAVAYAHRNLVIHRDLKPSNVLVEAAGHVRLLDFGIGQFTDSVDERTQTMWRAMTPGYAAPEQLRGAAPSTAIDIYGLGALLHRLLTGRTPQAATQGTDTTRPSLLVRNADDAYHRHYVPLKNDLDRVLLKALAEEPEQRYPTAEALADDLRRWLDGRPVLAQKPKLGYRLRKFVVRNKVGVAAAVLLTATLGGGIGATLWQAELATREAANARAQAERAMLVRDFLQQVFGSTDPSGRGEVPDALALLDEGARRARAELSQRNPLAAADILALTGGARIDLSEFGKALVDLEYALQLVDTHAPGAVRERSRILTGLGSAHRALGNASKAVDYHRQAMALYPQWDAPVAERLQARVALGMATVFQDPKAAEAEFRQVIKALSPAGLRDSQLHLQALNGLDASLGRARPDNVEHLPITEERLRLSRLLDGKDSGWYAFTLSDAVPTFTALRQYDRAEQVGVEAVRIAERIYAKPHRLRAIAHCQLASYLQQRRRYREALVQYDHANAMSTAVGESGLHIEACFRYRGYVRAALGQLVGALDDLARSRDMLVQHQYLQTDTGLRACGLQASIHLRLGDAAGADDALAQCPAGDIEPPLFHAQARAELHALRGEWSKASQLAMALRISNPPEASDRQWMRPWMLSLWLARQSGHDDLSAEMTSALTGYTGIAPLAGCLADSSNLERCLTLP